MSSAQHQEMGLFGQTLRMVAILVAACVLFVGALSTAAVVIASKAVGSPSESSSSSSAKSSTSSSSDDGAATPTKKPLSI